MTWPARSFVFLLLSFFSVLGGCNNFNNRLAGKGSAESDPLIGGPPAPVPGKSNQAPSPMPVTVLPPVTAPSGLSSPAALAAGTPRALDTSRDLRIGGTSPGADGWAARDPSPQSNGSGAVLMGVQPQAGAGPRPDTGSIYNPVSLSSSQVMSYEQAQKVLAARGVVWQKPTPISDTGEWEFSCALPNRQNPSMSRIYMARAPDLLGAIRVVLDKIDKEQ